MPFLSQQRALLGVMAMHGRGHGDSRGGVTAMHRRGHGDSRGGAAEVISRHSMCAHTLRTSEAEALTLVE